MGVGCDCLGLVRGIWRTFDGSEPDEVPAYADDWAEATKLETMLDAARRHMREIRIDDAQAGDVLLFRWRPNLPAKHCAILADRGERLIHAYDAAGKVVEGNLANEWRRRIAAAFSFPFLQD